MEIDYGNASYLTSAVTLGQVPPDEGFEIAFAGRSNSGKSSAINALCNKNQLARTSKTPGRTQMLNFFGMSARRRLVDLPGYGFARSSGRQRRRWQYLIEGYLKTRESLVGVVIVMDIRHPLKDRDLQMIEWCDTIEIPTLALLTKADKLSFGAAQGTASSVRARLRAEVSQVLRFSASKRQGVGELRNALNDWFSEAK